MMEARQRNCVGSNYSMNAKWTKVGMKFRLGKAKREHAILILSEVVMNNPARSLLQQKCRGSTSGTSLKSRSLQPHAQITLPNNILDHSLSLGLEVHNLVDIVITGEELVRPGAECCISWMRIVPTYIAIQIRCLNSQIVSAVPMIQSD